MTFGDASTNVETGIRTNGLENFDASCPGHAFESNEEQTADSTITVHGAESVVVLVAGATSYRNQDATETCKRTLLAAAEMGSWSLLRKRHVTDYTKLFGRVEFELDEVQVLPNVPTDARLSRALGPSGPSDVGLMVQMFQFSRYLLISSSRAGSQPANLAGIWADGLSSAWAGDYHLNINLQMNYWGAEVANLGETTAPLAPFLKQLVSGLQV
jgi:alpha-L-fucosidase 2